jgi:hypothetical protein
MTMMMNFSALAGQTPFRVIGKAAISLLIVGLAALVSREGLALSIMIIFTGVTGPTIRLVTMKMDGIYDRIIVSPLSKPRFFLGFAGYWVIAVLLPLVPAIAVVTILNGPVTIIPVILGTVLAVALGTLAGYLSRGLSEAHLAALLISGLLIPLSIIRTPLAAFLPFMVISSFPPGPAAFVLIVLLPAVALFVLALAVSRS